LLIAARLTNALSRIAATSVSGLRPRILNPSTSTPLHHRARRRRKHGERHHTSLAERKMKMAYHRYNPNQPRVPKGHADAGQWTDGGHSQNPRMQTAFAPSPFFQLGGRLLGGLVGRGPQKGIEAGLALFAALSADNDRDKRAIITFKAREYHRDETSYFDLEGVRLLNRNEVKNICQKLDDVQKRTDEAVARVNALRLNLRPADYGTKVHHELKLDINTPTKNPDFAAEISFLKTVDETGKQPEEPKYGTAGSIRIDVFEKARDDTVCVYDIKTGRSGLSRRRMAATARTVLKKHGAVRRIIVTEIRPTP
jgi:hypothetical protein